MAVTTKVEPINDWIELTVSRDLSPEARRRAVAEFASERIGEAQEINRLVLGRIPPHEVWVDGRRAAPITSVKADGGKIIVEFELIGDVMRWIGDELRRRSPVASGRYRDAHTLFADGKEVPLGGQIPPAHEYAFTNLMPYARKIEIGRTKSGRAFTISAPNMIYERTANAARRRFGNMALISFTYRGLIGLSSGAGVLVNPKFDPTRRNRKGAGAKAYNRPKVRFPTILVNVR